MLRIFMACLFGGSVVATATAEPVLAAQKGGDLEVRTDYQRGAVKPGDPFRLTVAVVNNGPDLARNVRARLSLPGNLQQVDTLGCGNDPQGVPDCRIGTLVPGETRDFSVRGVIPAGEYGALEIGVRALTGTPDPVTDNNASTAHIRPAFPEPTIDSRGFMLLAALVLTCATLLFIVFRENQRNYRLMRARY